MVETTFQFQHEIEKISNALGLSKDTENRCIEIIVFSCFSNMQIAEELFDDLKDAPKSLTTMTGDLEKSISLCSNEQERSYILLMFKQIHELVNEIIAKEKMLKKMDQREREKTELLFKLIDYKVKEKAMEENVDSFLTPSNLISRMKVVKESRYDFDKYLTLLEKNSIDDIISNILGDDD